MGSEGCIVSNAMNKSIVDTFKRRLNNERFEHNRTVKKYD